MLAPPAGARLTRRDYRALIEARFKTHPGARQHLMTYARYLAPRASAAALVITGPYADVARAYLAGLAPQSS